MVFGLQCDRTGATQNVGVFLCPAYHDYIALVNSKGGIEGYKIRVIEIDHEYKVPPGDGGARALQEGGRGAGGPLRHAADRRADQEARGGQDARHVARLRHRRGDRRQEAIPTSSRSRRATGRRARPPSPSPRRSSAAASRARRSPTSSTTTRPARSRLPFSRTSRRPRASRCRTFAVPAPGVEMGAQVLDITGRFKPDFVITHLFGRSPSVSIKELKGKGYPAEQGGLAGVGRLGGRHQGGRRLRRGRGLPHHAVRRRRQRLPGDQGHQRDVQGAGQAGAEGAGGQRLLQPRRHDRGDPRWRPSRNAIKAKGGAKPTSEDVKKGMEADQGLHAGRHGAADGDHPRPTTKAAAGCRSGPSRAASSSRTATGSRPTAT